MSKVNITSPVSTDTCIHRDTTHMATEMELAKQSAPINKIPKASVDSVMLVLVIRRGSFIPYKNSRHEGTFKTIILVDKEGTKFQTTLFYKHIETWKDFLKPNKTYYIAKGLLNHVNPTTLLCMKNLNWSSHIVQSYKRLSIAFQQTSSLIDFHHLNTLMNYLIVPFWVTICTILLLFFCHITLSL
ncbi:hypothetical protein EJD97_001635 [Solanum chilense]|uniref:DUF223 domain-containing protein n=1 Tax=Solanum chilense TaxID=4083 RepID=A0A6N2ANY9_SOLCI|nr:hypothetical protein EJD97_001635 [Solanum chilense]